jgi:glycosyltransferase involved in cell wall biosynthesis
VGTLAPHKGVHVLLEAFRGVTAREATLDIHGSLTVEPSYADTLRRSTRGDPRIRFRGPFTEGQQEHVLSELDALVLPSIWWENSPLTALEALASGRPVIASATGGVPEIVTHGESGWLVAPGDVEALREAMQGVAEGRLLGGAAPALPLKTASQGAGELAQVYADLRR